MHEVPVNPALQVHWHALPLTDTAEAWPLQCWAVVHRTQLGYSAYPCAALHRSQCVPV